MLATPFGVLAKAQSLLLLRRAMHNAVRVRGLLLLKDDCGTQITPSLLVSFNSRVRVTRTASVRRSDRRPVYCFADGGRRLNNVLLGLSSTPRRLARRVCPAESVCRPADARSPSVSASERTLFDFAGRTRGPKNIRKYADVLKNCVVAGGGVGRKKSEFGSLGWTGLQFYSAS